MKSEPSKIALSWQESVQQSGQHCNRIVKTIPKWLQTEGTHSSIIISTRIRLARNLAAHLFPGHAGEADLAAVTESVCQSVFNAQAMTNALCIDLSKISALDRRMLMERRLISPAGMLVMEPDEHLSIMINEEDHLRVQSIQPGLQITEAWEKISKLDDELGEVLQFAFSDRYGYLTACPTNTGTGMRVSIFVHLPALTLLNEIEETIRKFASSGIAIRGFYGEGSEVIGNIFQISNQLTLGRTETALRGIIEEVALKLLDLETKARERMLSRPRRYGLSDQVWRACGLLYFARVLGSVEFLNKLSMLRLGLDLGILKKNWSPAFLNEIMLFMQPGHLQKMHRGLRKSSLRDILRARLVREMLR